MKINLKKVASVLASAVMFGSTLGFAAAAWAEPFVKDGAGDAAIVYGTGSASTDYAAATDLATSLNAEVTVTGETVGTTGDSLKLEKSTNLFNLGENINSFYPTIDVEELSEVLADGVYTNDENNEYEYEQKITLGSMVLNQQKDDDFNDEKPFIGFDLTSGQPVFNYTLDFTEDAEGGTAFVNLETTEIEMLGMSYYIVDAAGTSNGVELTLLDNANSEIVSEGETSSIAVGATTYSVSVDYISDTPTTTGGSVILTVDGVKTNKLGEGDVFKVADDTYVAVKNILYSAKESGTSKVEISLGTGKIELYGDGDEVEMNGEDISTDTDQKVYAYITNSSTDISQIKLEWILDDDFWLAPGSDLLLPGFETVKLSMGGFNMPAEEITTIEADGKDVFAIDTELTDGEYNLPVLYMNTTTTGIAGYGSDDNELLVINRTAASTLNLNETENSYFVATWIDGDDSESYAFTIGSIDEQTDGDNKTVLDNLVDTEKTVSFSGIDDDADSGNINMVLVSANEDAKIATIKLSSATTSGTVYTDRIVTKEGMLIMLPTNVTLGSVAANAVNAYINITEEDDNSNVALGSSLWATISVDADDGAEVSAISPDSKYETEEDSDVYEDYLVSKLGTKILLDMPSDGLNSLELTYAGEESSADVYISETSVSFTDSTSIKVIKDSEIDSAQDKNLIVIGGSCINTVAATMLGASAPVCGEDFTALTGVAATKYLIQVAASPVNAEKIAMLVAGYDAAETTLGVAKVKEGTVATTVGTKEILPITTA